ncbi:acyl-coenzyme A thioesterase 13-like [Dioscorea cayenensis subsp. rotundata]|uniref:Acyl-coenzyme A thioesterase 13-like n=1 Tax=Dioscorea cayennensis subsp. rotundata TaxID=55577 RepID=A0AB40C453_DIOCR|nr:acyl-coenzyme A thioesterase 13-like [Dioscorea cayenensis subsp. rotundata]
MATPSEPQAYAANTKAFFERLGSSNPISDAADRLRFFSDLLRSLLKADLVETGRIICSFVVNPALTNLYNTLHGGAVASVAEVLAVACAKSVAGDIELFTGETATSYLSAARVNEEVEVEGRVLRKGRRVIVTEVNLRIKKTGRMLYTNRSTFYVMPLAKL